MEAESVYSTTGVTTDVPSPMKTAAIILAGGSGSRVQQAVNKVYLPIRERPVLACLETFERAPSSTGAL